MFGRSAKDRCVRDKEKLVRARCEKLQFERKGRYVIRSIGEQIPAEPKK